jgi:hypothetical protein
MIEQNVLQQQVFDHQQASFSLSTHLQQHLQYFAEINSQIYQLQQQQYLYALKQPKPVSPSVEVAPWKKKRRIANKPFVSTPVTFQRNTFSREYITNFVQATNLKRFMIHTQLSNHYTKDEM